MLWQCNPLPIRIDAAYLCSSFFDHLQLTLVDLDAPEETIKKPQEDPTCQPEQKHS